MRAPPSHNSLSAIPALQPMALFQNEMSRMFNHFFGRVPAIDIIEDIKHYEVQAELPGLEPDNVEITASGGFLTIKGEHSGQQEKSDKNYLYSETSSRSFQRTVALPEDADTDKISEAAFSNGVLTVTIPKKEDAPQSSRKIKIRKQEEQAGQ